MPIRVPSSTSSRGFSRTVLVFAHSVADLFPRTGDAQAIRSCSIKTSTPTRSCARTRIPEALDPIVATESTASEAHEFFHALEASSQSALARGNMVQAAIQLQRPFASLPADSGAADAQAGRHHTRRASRSLENRSRIARR